MKIENFKKQPNSIEIKEAFFKNGHILEICLKTNQRNFFFEEEVSSESLSLTIYDFNEVKTNLIKISLSKLKEFNIPILNIFKNKKDIIIIHIYEYPKAKRNKIQVINS